MENLVGDKEFGAGVPGQQWKEVESVFRSVGEFLSLTVNLVERSLTRAELGLLLVLPLVPKSNEKS